MKVKKCRQPLQPYASDKDTYQQKAMPEIHEIISAKICSSLSTGELDSIHLKEKHFVKNTFRNS